MKFCFRTWRALLLGVFACLIGCGGGGSGQPIQTVPDVLFTNVKVTRTSAMPGEKAVVVATFQATWKGQAKYAVSRLVFKNQYSTSISEVVGKFRLVDGTGGNLNGDAGYSVSVDSGRQEIVVNFLGSPWKGSTPASTYSLLADVSPNAKDGQHFAFNLTKIQMQDAGKMASSDVVGGDFKVTNVAGKGLPVVVSSSPAAVIIANTHPGDLLNVGNFVVRCPADNTYFCLFSGATYRSSGVVVPYFTVGGNSVTTSIESQSDGSYKAVVSYAIFPGTEKTFVMNVSTPDASPELTFTTRIQDVTFTLGGTSVSPVVLTGAATCGNVIAAEACNL